MDVLFSLVVGVHKKLGFRVKEQMYYLLEEQEYASPEVTSVFLVFQ